MYVNQYKTKKLFKPYIIIFDNKEVVMKEKFLNSSINILQKQYNYDNDTLDRVKYGLEVIYINVTKISVILLTSLLFKIFKETLLLILFVNFIRMFAYGLHAKKSWHCYVSSILCFVLLPLYFINTKIDILQKIIISIFTLLSIILFAPSDTEKRPLINAKHRKKLKYNSILVASIYIILIFIIKDQYFSNLILLSLIIQSMLINPIIYKLFDLPYNNYKSYKKAA